MQKIKLMVNQNFLMFLVRKPMLKLLFCFCFLSYFMVTNAHSQIKFGKKTKNEKRTKEEKSKDKEEKSKDKLSLTVSGYNNVSELKKYVKNIEKGQENLKDSAAGTYIELDIPSGSSKKLYQFSFEKSSRQNIQEALKKGMGLLEPVYKLEFNVRHDEEDEDIILIEYFLVADWEASKILYDSLTNKMFNLYPFETTRAFDKKFSEEVNRRSKQFAKKYFEFQKKIIDDKINDQIDEAEGELSGSFAGAQAVIQSMNGPLDSLKRSGEYRLHNNTYYKNFIEPLGFDVGFIISPSNIIYNIFNRILTEPNLQPGHNIKIFAIKFYLQNKYEEENETYKAIREKERFEEFKRLVIRELMDDVAVEKAKREDKKYATLTKEEKEDIMKKIESNPSLIQKYIREKDLVNTYEEKKRKELLIEGAKDFKQSISKFSNLLKLYENGVTASNQLVFLDGTTMKKLTTTGGYASGTKAIQSKISVLDNYEEFIKMDKKTSQSRVGKALKSIGRNTELGSSITSSSDQITSQFNKGINQITTVEDAKEYFKNEIEKLKTKADELYDENSDVSKDIQKLNLYHFQKLREVLDYFKLTTGEDTATLEED